MTEPGSCEILPPGMELCDFDSAKQLERCKQFALDAILIAKTLGEDNPVAKAVMGVASSMCVICEGREPLVELQDVFKQ